MRRRQQEDEMIGWHLHLSGHEVKQTLGDGKGQGILVCCSPWGHKELDMTEWLNSTNNKYVSGSWGSGRVSYHLSWALFWSLIWDHWPDLPGLVHVTAHYTVASCSQGGCRGPGESGGEQGSLRPCLGADPVSLSGNSLGQESQKANV